MRSLVCTMTSRIAYSIPLARFVTLMFAKAAYL